MGTSPARLGAAIWAFVVWKALGVLASLAYLVFAVRWALPRVSGSGWQGEFLAQLGFEVLETILTVAGIILVLRRHRRARLFWMALLGYYCLARLGEALFGGDPGTAAIFLVTGIGWLAYWIWGRGPRQLAITAFWTEPSATSRP